MTIGYVSGLKKFLRAAFLAHRASTVGFFHLLLEFASPFLFCFSYVFSPAFELIGGFEEAGVCCNYIINFFVFI